MCVFVIRDVDSIDIDHPDQQISSNITDIRYIRIRYNRSLLYFNIFTVLYLIVLVRLARKLE